MPGDESRDSLSDLQSGHHPRSSSAGSRPSVDTAVADDVEGLYNIPRQRTSLASHSLDDLDTPSPNPSTNNSSINNHHNHGIHHRRQRPDSHDRSACRCLKAFITS